ncbi:hydrolase of alkaline phosphatase superfamily [Vibrio astriarenae]|nr:hydrolase of alkaline phosphatase superfamily [Vibrio sp. C7]
MPFTYRYANNALSFTEHYSSSNDVQGIFGLFYGLPTSYLSSVANQDERSILLSTMAENEYQFGLFSGDNFDDDLYEQVVFKDMPIINVENDEQIAQAWGEWAAEQTDEPWFSFIELMTVEQFNPVAEYKGSTRDILRQGYAESVRQADEQLRQLFEQLALLEDKDETVVVITSNHGIEFNETETNSWGAGSNYSKYQLSVPLVIKWPGKLSAQYDHPTSHLDISVTLMEELLGASSNPSDYSSGRNLFNERKRNWVIAGNNSELALLTKRNTTVVDRFGNFKIYDEQYRRLKDASPTLPVLMQGLTELQRFYND